MTVKSCAHCSPWNSLIVYSLVCMGLPPSSVKYPKSPNIVTNKEDIINPRYSKILLLDIKLMSATMSQLSPDFSLEGLSKNLLFSILPWTNNFSTPTLCKTSLIFYTRSVQLHAALLHAILLKSNQFRKVFVSLIDAELLICNIVFVLTFYWILL